MVLEELWETSILRNNPVRGFFLGVIYSFLGIAFAYYLFPNLVGIVSIAFISILSVPSLTGLVISMEETQRKGGRITFFSFFRGSIPVAKVYLGLFFGIMLVFSITTLLLPSDISKNLFGAQFQIDSESSGGSTTAAGTVGFDRALFAKLVDNNFRVLVLCFIMSFIIGNGAVFFITWNASVWGVVFGNLANGAAIGAGQDPLLHGALYFFLIFVMVFPHMLLEILSYIVASISGSLMSRSVITEKVYSSNQYLHRYAGVFAAISKSPAHVQLVREKEYSERFPNILMYTMFLLVIAVLLVVVAGIVETYVLTGNEVYRTIWYQSYLAR